MLATAGWVQRVSVWNAIGEAHAGSLRNQYPARSVIVHVTLSNA